jgi:hypothetical protein
MQWPGEELVGRLWDTVANKGIGSLLKPWQMRREGRASIELKRDELLVLAQAKHNAERIERGELTLAQAMGTPVSGETARPRLEPHIDPTDLRAIAADIATAEVIRGEVNVTRALLHAETELEGDSQVPPQETVDEDWLYRWRDNASQVSTEELQSLWGRLLAGEVKAPGTFSLRTLEFLKNLSHAEASNIAKLADLSFGDWIFKPSDDFLAQFGLTFSLLMELQQLGVIAGTDSLGLTITMQSEPVPPHTIVAKLNGWVVLGESDEPNQPCAFPAYLITPLGRQVLSLCKPEAQVNYLRKIGAFMKSQGFRAKLAQYADISATQLRYVKPETL